MSDTLLSPFMRQTSVVAAQIVIPARNMLLEYYSG
jgi:hypothetical protein